MKRHHTGLRRERSRVRRRTDAELDVTRFDELKNLRLLAELGTRILIDQNRPATQFLELVGEKIARDAIPGGLWLVIGKAIMLCLLRQRGGDPNAGENPKRNLAYRIAYRGHLTLPIRFVLRFAYVYHALAPTADGDRILQSADLWHPAGSEAD